MDFSKTVTAVVVFLTRELRTRTVPISAAMLFILFVTWPVGILAHDIPNDVTIRAFVKPEGDTLRVIIRVPLASINDIDFPMHDADTLDLARAEPFLRDAATQWLAEYIEFYEENTKLGYPRVPEVRASLPSDASFATYEQALAHVTGSRLSPDTYLVKAQGMLDVLFEYPIHSDRSNFGFRPDFSRLGLRVVTVLRFLPPGGAIRAFEYEGNPGLVRLDPRWYQAAWRFVVMGFNHILDGTDHLLFLFCLVVPFRRFRGLIPVVTAFTVAHSVTLIASAYNLGPDALWFPPLIETLIATSIVYMALENIVAAGLKRRWLITFGFGLVHGFGFSFALRQTLQFAGAHLLTSLLSFNIGVELGQIFMLALMIPALEILFRFIVAERMGTIIVSALAAHTAWHWLMERYAVLSKYRIQWPALDAAFLAILLRWMMLAVALAAAAWLVSVVRQSRRTGEGREVTSLKSEV